jgi:hypothetical protein
LDVIGVLGIGVCYVKTRKALDMPGVFNVFCEMFKLNTFENEWFKFRSGFILAISVLSHTTAIQKSQQSNKQSQAVFVLTFGHVTGISNA